VALLALFGLRPGWPVIDDQPAHREVLGVAGGETRPDAGGCGRDQAVRLPERDAGR